MRSPPMVPATARAACAARAEISGPMKASASPFQGPIERRSARPAVASITFQPKASSGTISRRAHEQR